MKCSKETNENSILKPGPVKTKPGKNCVQALCAHTGPAHIRMPLVAVISSMNVGPVTEGIHNNHVIIEYGEHLLNKCGVTLKSQQCIREKKCIDLH